MLSLTVYPIFAMILWTAALVFVALLTARLIFNYSDPNPFGTIGRLGFKIRKATERFVYPASRFLSTFRVDARLGPLLTIFLVLVITYFLNQIVGNTFFIIDGMTAGVAGGNPKMVIGFVLYALLSLLVLFIFIRFLAQWFVFTRKTFLAFVMRVTDPIIRPAQRLIPPIGMFDISAMLVLIFISLLQSLVLSVFVRQ